MYGIDNLVEEALAWNDVQKHKPLDDNSLGMFELVKQTTMFPAVRKAILIALTLPATSCTVGRRGYSSQITMFISATTRKNIALHKNTFASSSSLKHQKLVDGDYSESIRMNDTNEWVGVDLGHTEHVDSVQVYFKQKTSRDSFIIGVVRQQPTSNSSLTNPILYSVCARYYYSSSDDVRVDLSCSFPVFGRYVVLVPLIWHRNKFDVVELKIYAKQPPPWAWPLSVPLEIGGHRFVVFCMLVLLAYPSTLASAGWKGPFMENVALLRPTVQSGGSSSALLAVEGNFDPSRCSSTGDVSDLWWTVVLQRETIVTHVSVTTCEDTQADFVIGLTDSPIDASHPPSDDYWLCASHSGQLPIGTTTFTCQPTVVSGRFLFIRRTKDPNAALTLSEVQVYSVVSPLPRMDLGQPDTCREIRSGDVIWSGARPRKNIAAVRLRMNPSTSCADIQHGGANKDGVYTIYPRGRPLQVYCDLTTDNGGWTMGLVNSGNSCDIISARRLGLALPLD
ncbi:hypothetical protein NP493_684g00030 [Ridgeia piscesae]|uniref:Fibrinogen C-terminal domain-containing protein n=1 Tax=Ridgeia piscesae TaxID=27915 RepID=A0AAD9KR09_RIDPI|nr:hypothetical protein NP493_684g00030 [Ridgeia piscesae]